MNGWLFSKKTDIAILFIPVWITWLVSFLIPDELYAIEVPIWFWVFLVLGIDVAHVWSTIFRTYLDKEEFSNHRLLLIYTPIIAFLSCALLAGISIDLFWRVLAYLAVFHFVKQQYGFLALYIYRSKKRINKKIFKDKWVIFFSMLYPILYWHLAGLRNFDWLETNDFYYLNSLIGQLPLSITLLKIFGNIIYFTVIGGWLIEDVYQTLKNKTSIQTGKILWMITTATNWYLGIVFFNSDLVFTLTNVVAHGVPYVALITYYKIRKLEIANKKPSSWVPVKWVGIILISVFSLAFTEEYLWDLFLFREKGVFFENFLPYFTNTIKNPILQAVVFGILSIPQVSHYILDGFIWKGNKKNPYVKIIFSPN